MSYPDHLVEALTLRVEALERRLDHLEGRKHERNISPVENALRAWRDRQAELESRRPRQILRDEVLISIARRLPTSAGELMLYIKGFGITSFESYGEAILEVVRDAQALSLSTSHSIDRGDPQNEKR